MKFSYFDTLIRADIPYQEILQNLRGQAVFCDQLGFETLWLGEHHFSVNGIDTIPSPILMGADIACRTEKLRVGQACNAVPYWHPLRLAEEIAQLDQMTQGRVDVAFGKGTNPRDALSFHPAADPRDRAMSNELYAESIEIIRKAWTNKFFSHKGKYYEFPPRGVTWQHPMTHPETEWMENGVVTKLCLAPKPYQLPHPPLWMVSDSDHSLRFAAENDLNGIIWQPPVNTLRKAMLDYKAYREAKTGKPHPFGQNMGIVRTVYVAPTMEEARRDAERGVMFKYGWIHPPRRPLDIFMNPGEAVTNDMSVTWDFLFERNLLVGSPEYVAEKIQELQEVAGVQYLMTWMSMPYIPQEKILRSLELFGTKVMPIFKDAKVAAPQVVAAE